MIQYKHQCATMEVLLWESEQTSKPASHLVTMPAQTDDLAWVDETQKSYVFKDGIWQEIDLTSNSEPTNR